MNAWVESVINTTVNAILNLVSNENKRNPDRKQD